LDGLAAMQVEWHFRGGAARAAAAAAAAAPAAGNATIVAGDNDGDDAASFTDKEKPNIEAATSEESADITASDVVSDEWADTAAQSVAHAYKALEAQAKKKKTEAGTGAMDLEKGTVTFKVVEDASQLQEVLKQLSKGARGELLKAAGAVDADELAAGETSATGSQESLSDLMMQLLGGTESVNVDVAPPDPEIEQGSESAESEADSRKDMVANVESILEGKIQELLKGHSTTASDTDSEDGKDPKKKKVEVRFVKFDQTIGDGGEITGDIAQTIAEMFSKALEQSGAGDNAASESDAGDVADNEDDNDDEGQDSDDQVFY